MNEYKECKGGPYCLNNHLLYWYCLYYIIDENFDR